MPTMGFESKRKKRGPKNVLLGVMTTPLLLWQRTDKDGEIHTELGVEVKPGDVRRLPPDLWNKSQPVNNNLQEMLATSLHGKKAVETPAAKPRSKEAAKAQLPPEITVP